MAASRFNIWIGVLTLPAVAFLLRLMMQLTMTQYIYTTLKPLYYYLPLLSNWSWFSPIFVVIQLALIMRGKAASSWQNVLCVGVTVIAAMIRWGGILAWTG